MTMNEPLPNPADGDPEPFVNRMAVYSVLYGIGAFACLYFFPFGCLALGVPSITTGIFARRDIRASHGEQTGDSVAVMGLTIGGGALVTGFIVLVLSTVQSL